jgi:hypothetical protein
VKVQSSYPGNLRRTSACADARASSSPGRAPRLHRGGSGFESCLVHHRKSPTRVGAFLSDKFSVAIVALVAARGVVMENLVYRNILVI